MAQPVALASRLRNQYASHCCLCATVTPAFGTVQHPVACSNQGSRDVSCTVVKNVSLRSLKPLVQQIHRIQQQLNRASGTRNTPRTSSRDEGRVLTKKSLGCKVLATTFNNSAELLELHLVIEVAIWRDEHVPDFL